VKNSTFSPTSHKKLFRKDWKKLKYSLAREIKGEPGEEVPQIQRESKRGIINQAFNSTY